jgi:hypothetical protein
LVAELSAPRFLAGGDQTRVALDLTNLSGQAQTLEVQLAASGQLSLGDGSDAYRQSVALDNGQRTTLRVPVRALGGFGTGKLAVSVNGLELPNEQLPPFSREWQIGVRSAWPARVAQFRSVLKGNGWSLPTGTLAQFEPAGLEALLSVSSRPPLNLAEQIRALKAYPYGCLERSTPTPPRSSAWASKASRRSSAASPSTWASSACSACSATMAVSASGARTATRNTG